MTTEKKLKLMNLFVNDLWKLIKETEPMDVASNDTWDILISRTSEMAKNYPEIADYVEVICTAHFDYKEREYKKCSLRN